jgi:hypothetical protein
MRLADKARLSARALFVSVSGFSQWSGLFDKRLPAFFGLHRIKKRSRP